MSQVSTYAFKQSSGISKRSMLPCQVSSTNKNNKSRPKFSKLGFPCDESGPKSSTSTVHV